MSKTNLPKLFPSAMVELPEMVSVMPAIDTHVEMPKNKNEAIPAMTTQQEVDVRSHTIKILSDIQGDGLEPTTEEIEEAEGLAKEMMTNPELKIEYGNYPNETIAYLAGLVAQTSHMVAKDLADIKLSVLNGLLQEAATAPSPRERISAWSKIGEIDGVDAFKKKTEIIHINKTGKELEEELLRTIQELKGKVIEGEVIDEDEDD
jgi:hypothetical protein